MDPYMQYQPDGADGPTFRWHGGAYIDIGSVQDVGQDGIDGDDFHAYDVINVWDYATDAPRIPRTLNAFQARCDERIADDAEEAASLR